MTYKDAKHITHSAGISKLENIVKALQLMQWQDNAETRRQMKAARLLRDETRREMRRASLNRRSHD